MDIIAKLVLCVTRLAIKNDNDNRSKTDNTSIILVSLVILVIAIQVLDIYVLLDVLIRQTGH